MLCQKCKSDSFVKDSRPSEKLVRRRRVCKLCGHSWKTFEVSEEIVSGDVKPPQRCRNTPVKNNDATLDNTSPQFVSMNRAMVMTSLSRTMINKYRAEGRFPQSVLLGDRRFGFIKSEVDEWINQRIASRGNYINAPACFSSQTEAP